MPECDTASLVQQCRLVALLVTACQVDQRINLPHARTPAHLAAVSVTERLPQAQDTPGVVPTSRFKREQMWLTRDVWAAEAVKMGRASFWPFDHSKCLLMSFRVLQNRESVET